MPPRQPPNTLVDIAAQAAQQRQAQQRDDGQDVSMTSEEVHTPATPAEPEPGGAALAQREDSGAIHLRDTVYAVHLRKIQGPQPNEAWQLPRTRPVLVGRFGKAKPLPMDVDLAPDTNVSRRHARIWFEGEVWWIEDLRSKNGTWIDDNNIKGRGKRRLRPGTKILIGETVLMLALSATRPGIDSEMMPEDADVTDLQEI